MTREKLQRKRREADEKLTGFFGDKFHKNVFLICLAVAVGLIIASFLTPPMWIIDKSVLLAVGELFGFAALAEIMAAIERGHSASITHGNTTIEIKKGADDDDEEKED